MAKAVSCGFIIFERESGAILACHPNGRPLGPEMSYDIPKGHMEEGESPIDTARRELREETGMVLPGSSPIHEIGLVPYQKAKSLYLFSTSVPGLSRMVRSLHCDSTFVDSFGNTKTEIDSYAVTYDTSWFFKNMQSAVMAEAARVRLPAPICVVKTHPVANPKDTILAKMEFGDGRYSREVFVAEMNYARDSASPESKCALTLSDGTEVETTLGEVMEGISEQVAVDIDGSYSALPDIPFEKLDRGIWTPILSKQATR